VLIALLASALAVTGAVSAAASTLALKAPKGTRFGHRIDFVGRLAPNRPGTLVRLFRGRRFVASGKIRRDGTFRIRVFVANPGPFHAQAAGVSSPEVMVRIHPLLEARFIGTRVVGERLRLLVRVRPATAGALRVRVVRGGKQTLAHIFHGDARVRLGTAALGRLHVRVETVPRRGYAYVSHSLGVELVPPRLEYGSISPAVSELARRLAALHYAVASTSPTFDGDLLESVYAFQKVDGLPRTGVVDAALWTRLERARIPQPRYRSPPDHLEVDKGRQVLLVVHGGEVTLVSPVSTAGIAGYYTPEGRFAIYRKVVGYDPSPLGVLLNPMYFTGGYAIHGNPSVPPYPASHGCVRVPNFVIFRIFGVQPYGETVYVY
jgi:hypothetical protein